jgi:hypothetical protein
MIVIFNKKLFLTKFVDIGILIIYPHLDAIVIAIKRKSEYSYRMAAILFGYVLQKYPNKSCAFYSVNILGPDISDINIVPRSEIRTAAALITSRLGAFTTTKSDKVF